MNKWKYSFITGWILALALPAVLQGQTVTRSALSRDSILIGDQIVWSTRLSVPEGERVEVFPYAPVLKESRRMPGAEPDSLYDDPARVEVIEDFVLDTVSVSGGVQEVDVRAILTSFDSGAFKLPRPVILHIADGHADTLDFSTPVLRVNTIQIDTASFTPFDIKGQMLYPVTFREVLPWILAVAGVLALAWAVCRYIRHRREHRNFFGKPVVKDPPHIVALRELDRLRMLKLWQNGKEKQYYTGITDTLRVYIEQRYGVSAMEKTSSEIMDSLEAERIEARSYRELDELFKLADLVKFAKYFPSAQENEEAIPCAVRFVNSTFMQELEEEKGGK